MVCLPVSADLAAGTLRLSRCDMIAVAGVVPSGQEKISSAVMTAAGRVAGHQAAVKIGVKKVGKAAGLFRYPLQSGHHPAQD